MQTIRIFISSPGDVVEERNKARQVIEQLQKRYAGQLQLVPVLWEDLPLELDSSFQEGIDTFLSEKHRIDVAVFIIWSRLGSPVGPKILRPDGTTYKSGTEREFDLTLAARNASKDDRPAMLAYVREDPATFQANLGGKSTVTIQEIIEQKSSVENFIQTQFQDAESSTNTRAYHIYEKPIEFAHRVRVHIQGLLDEMVNRTPGAVRWEGAPFRGLEVFDIEHEPIFFGRESEVTEVLLAMHARAKNGCGAVVVAGASGAGKSSLIRAGVIPALVHKNLDSSTGEWRYAIVQPGAAAPDFLRSLTQALLSETALPGLRDRLTNTEHLVESLRDAPESAYKLLLGPALSEMDLPSHPARLLIFVDQLEELFTYGRGHRDSIDQFFQTLRQLAETDRIRVVATVRSDFYAQCQEFPDFVVLKQGEGFFDLLPPGPSALERVITRPALLAGLRFEEDKATGRTLDRQILDDATANVEHLPLLQFALRELFENRTSDGELTFASYEQSGCVIGALSCRAEFVFSSLSSEGQQALGDVFNELVTISEEDDTAITRQLAPLSRVSSSASHSEFVEKFTTERLFVTDRDAFGNPTVTVAHEVLLRDWDRAAQWIDSNREFLLSRARVQQDLDRWLREDQSDDFLITAGKPLEDARALLVMGRKRLTDDQISYIAQSSEHHDNRGRRQLRRVRVAAGIFLALMLASVGAGLLAWRQMNVANTEAVRNAMLNVQLEENLYENRIAVAEREIEQNHDIDLAGQLLDSCPPKLRGWEWHYLMRRRDEENLSLTDHRRGVWSVAFSPSGDRIVSASIDGTARIWDTYSGEKLLLFEKHNRLKDSVLQGIRDVRDWLSPAAAIDIIVKRASFSPDGKHVATGSINPNLFNLRLSKASIKIWESETGNVVQDFEGQTGLILSLDYSPDGARIASSSVTPDHTFVVWETATGEVVKVVSGHKGHVYNLKYSPDGRLLLSGGIDGAIKFWDANSLELLRSVDAHPAPVMDLVFAPSGDHFASAGQDGTVRIWETATGNELRVLKGHSGSALSLDWHPKGNRLVSSGFDKTVRVWNPETGRQKLTLRGHDDAVWSVKFSPDGNRLVSGSYDDTIRIWDATPLAESQLSGEITLAGHQDRVNEIAYSPDGQILATSSWDRTIRLWDAATGEHIRTLAGHVGATWGLTFTSDGEHLVSAGWDEKAILWDVANGTIVREFDANAAPVHAVALTPDDKFLISSGWDGLLKIWDVEDGSVIHTIDASLLPVLGIDVSPDGSMFATVSGDCKLKLWNVRTGRELVACKPHEATAYDVCFSPDGERIATASWDKTARVWNVDSLLVDENLTPYLTLDEHTDRVYSVAFSPDGQHLATSSNDKLVRIWDASTGVPIGKPLHHRGPVWAVAYSPVDSQLAAVTWSTSGWVKIWNMLQPDSVSAQANVPPKQP